MALRSAKMAYLNVPDKCFDRAMYFLDSVQLPAQKKRPQGLFSYMPGSSPSHVMTAEGLLCRQYGGWKRDFKPMVEGVDFLLEQYPPKRYPADTPEVYQPQVIQAIDRATRGDAIVVADVGQHQMFAAQHYQYTQPYTFITSGGLGTMGYSLPAAIGAQMARPDKQVWCVVGDGCFQMTLQELAVMAAHRVPVKVALLNNEYLGLIRQASIGYEMNYQVDIHYDDYGTDNVKIMEAYGCSGRRVFAPDEIRPTLEWARKQAAATSRPVLVEIMIEREANTPHGPAIDAVREFEPLPEQP